MSVSLALGLEERDLYFLESFFLSEHILSWGFVWKNSKRKAVSSVILLHIITANWKCVDYEN